MAAPNTSLRPKARPENILPKEEPMFEINSREYRGKEVPVIKFKDGNEMYMFEVEQMLQENKTSPEPVPGKATTKEILNFLRGTNPTKDEFIKFFTAKRANKGGLFGPKSELERQREVNIAEQMQSMLPSADEDTRSTEEYLQHPLETVPFFQRPIGSSTKDLKIGEDDAGNPVFQTSMGNEYTVKLNPDQRTLRKKVSDAIPVVKEAVTDYIEDPKLPTKEQLSKFAKQAGQSAVESVEDLGDLMFKGEGTTGDVFVAALSAGTASVPFNVPKGALRIFGGVNAEGTAKDKNLKRAIKLLKKSGVDPTSGPSNARPIYKELDIHEVNKDIWEKTGWYVDPTDGQWRFEIDDSKSNLKDFKSVFKTNKNPDDPADDPNLSSSFFEELGKVARSREDGVYNKLGNVLEHEEFFKKYPDLKDVDVIFYSDPSQRNLLGSAGEDEIFINVAAYKDYENIKSTLLHEMQHIIQAEEDFVPGASSKYVPNFLTENKSREIKTKVDPLKVQERKLQAELDLLIPHRKNTREKYANNPLKNLSESDQIAIYKLKPINRETGISAYKDYEGPSWASIARDYDVPVQEVKAAYGRQQLLEKIDKEIIKYNANLNKIINDLYELELEDFRIDRNFYRGAGGEIESRLVQHRQNLSPEERGKSFPIEDRLTMLQGEGGKFEYTGKHGVDPHQYTLKPRNEPEEEKSFLSKVGKKLGFNEGGDVSAQMQSMMIPSADQDIRPEDYVQYREDNFTAASFAEDSWEDTKKRFMDAGRIDVNPDDPAIFTAYKRAVDYLKDTGLAGLGLADTAFKYAVGSAAQVMPTEALEKRMARDLYSMPEAFAGAAGARSLTQLDDAADAFLEGSLHVARKAGQMKPDPNTLASFAGAVPPTYMQRDTPLSEMGEYQLDYFRQVEPTEKTNLKRTELLQFREPISEFIETLTIPKKGMLGSEFLTQIKKNPSIPETSLQEGIIDPSKRYTREELLGAIGVGKNTQGTFRSSANISPYRVKQYEGNQRQQKHAGFQGGREVEYFDIPIDTTIGYPGKSFRANYQHYNPETLVHVRGSIVSPYRQSEFSPRKIKEFDKIIGGKNYLLGEELQSDLLTKGYTKPNNFFDTVFSEATKNWSTDNFVTYREAFGTVDKEIKKILKLLDDPSSAHLAPGRVSSNPKFYRLAETDPRENYKKGVSELLNLYRWLVLAKESRSSIAPRNRIDYSDLSDHLAKTNANEKDIDQVFETLKANQWPDGSPILLRKMPTEDEDTLHDILDLDFANDDELLNLPEVNSVLDEGIKEDFLKYHKKRQQDVDSATEEYLNFIQSQIDELKINDTIDVLDLAELHENMTMAQSYLPDNSGVGLPPIRKNKQAVDEALKVLIAKAAQSGVDKIVIPPASRIALARGRELKKDKGDRLYRTYVTDLNKSLKELEENYPVVIHRDVEMPYGSRGKESTDELIGFEDIDQDPGFDAEIDPEITNLLNEMAGDIDMEAIGQQITELVDQNLNVAIDAGNPDAVIEASAKIFDAGDKGIIIDISELVNRFKVEQPRQFAQGGVAMNEQTEMAFMQQGGLQDDGMNQDPVSGNEVPSGSMASEVRDDISAQLSEGEYVVPADVVRYLGVKHFEDLRDKAKNGLNKMEADGRIGGEPVPVGGPKAGLRPDEMQEIQNMFEGGMVAGAANGADFSFYNPTGSTVEEAVTTPGPAGRPMYSGEFSFEQPGAGLATPPPVSGTSAPEQQAITLYGPNGEIINLMLPKDQVMYDQLIAQGYGLTAPQTVKSESGSKKDEVKADPNAWMDKYDYTNSGVLMQQSLNALDPKEGLEGMVGKVFGGGVFGFAQKANNAAEQNAHLRLLKAQGVETTELEEKLAAYIKNNNLDILPDSWIDGDQKEGDIRDQIGGDLFKHGDKAYTVPETKTVMQGAAKDTAGQFLKTVVDPVTKETKTVGTGGSEEGKRVYKPGGIDVALLETPKPKKKKKSEPSFHEQMVAKSREKSEASRQAMQRAQDKGGSSKDVADLKKKYEGEGGTWASGGRARGGLMKKKKKSKK